MNHSEENRKQHPREKQRSTMHIIFVILIGLLLIAALITGGILLGRYRFNNSAKVSVTQMPTESATPEIITTAPETEETGLADLLGKAADLAAEYDYDGAIRLLASDSHYALAQEVVDAAAAYTEEKAKLVQIDPQDVTHVFFHSLIVDTSKAFNGSKQADGYNQMMTTKSEFIKILQSMYDKGYVLVKIHDLAYETTAEDGSSKFVYGSIMLPEGKKAFVMSQDDVCYYEYMKGDGFATRMVIGEDGYPTTEMEQDDGSTATGDFDLVPILEGFIKEHPGFSYKGARAILALTGYNGILGYRTDESYKDTNPNYEADRNQAAKVAQCLKEHGWELASHSWGHRNLGTISIEQLKQDSQKWDQNVESLIGPTDIMIYPFGSDIGTWKPYTDDNERFTYLKSLGFRYFCNVDASKPCWMQLGTDHFRQARRNLDGYRMYYDADGLSDLFNVSDVFDPARPTPVPGM